MPYAKRRRIIRRRPRSYARRVTRRRFTRRTTRRNSRASRTIIRGPQPVADFTLVKLVYNDTFTTLPYGGTQAYYVYRGNSPYDPDFTGIGTQPYGFDQWATWYNRYYVIASRITVTWFNQDVKTKAFVINASNELMDEYPSTLEYIYEQPYTSMAWSPGSFSSGTGIAPHPKPVKMKAWMKTTKISGQKDPDDSDYDSTTDGNPTNLWYWNLLVYNQDTTTLSTNAITYSVKIKYYVKFSERKFVESS